jgi:hypothetical protein
MGQQKHSWQTPDLFNNPRQLLSLPGAASKAHQSKTLQHLRIVLGYSTGPHRCGWFELASQNATPEFAGIEDFSYL